MGTGDEMTAPGDLEGSFNMVSSIWSFEGMHIDLFGSMWVELQLQ